MNDRIDEQIKDIEREIAILPKGSIGKKTVKDKIYFYHRYTENGKKIEKYVDKDVVEELKAQIERRKKLEKELKRLRALLPMQNIKGYGQIKFNSFVRVGKELAKFAEPVKKQKKRECFSKLEQFVYGNSQDRVFILYGLRRTGKTTMIRQIIADMAEKDLSQAAFIQISVKDTLASVNEDMKILEGQGYKYVFIDEVTLMEDFIEGAALFSDVYATCGMKIVLSGTDSLGFILAEDEQLYDRCFLLHTTFIPYREFENVLGIKGIDEYIRYGGTMSLSGINYNEESVFADSSKVNDYVDSAIARNIQHSLRYYQNGGHFRHLIDLYEKDELTSAINRVVEDVNHRFTVDVITNEFISNDFSISARNLRRDRNNSNIVLDKIDYEAFIDNLKERLDILDKSEQTVFIEEAHAVEIREYLQLLDLIYEIEKLSLSYVREPKSVTVISQPGIRYAQAQAFIECLLSDNIFSRLSYDERNAVTKRILSEISGRMMEEIVLLETKLAYPKRRVFKLQFAVGEFDMVIADTQAGTCEIYEVKYSKEVVSEQYRHLIDEQKCNETEHRFGKIVSKNVIYRGDEKSVDGISYLNVETYLKNL